jgi:hypothetical protein
MHNHPSKNYLLVSQNKGKNLEKRNASQPRWTSQFYITPEKKAGLHKYSASIEINMHETCYGSDYPYSTCWVIPVQLYQPLCNQQVNSAHNRTPVQQNSTYPGAGYLDCQLSGSTWLLG